MYSSLADISDELDCDIQSLFDLWVRVEHRREFFIFLKRQRDIRRSFGIDFRKQLGNMVGSIKWYAHHTSYIFECCFVSHRHKSTNIDHIIMSVFGSHIVEHFDPTFIIKIHINIRQRYSCRIKKSLKQQSELQRIHISNSLRIRQ